jgi:hypothetical protein
MHVDAVDRSLVLVLRFVNSVVKSNVIPTRAAAVAAAAAGSSSSSSGDMKLAQRPQLQPKSGLNFFEMQVFDEIAATNTARLQAQQQQELAMFSADDEDACDETVESDLYHTMLLLRNPGFLSGAEVAICVPVNTREQWIPGLVCSSTGRDGMTVVQVSMLMHSTVSLLYITRSMHCFKRSLSPLAAITAIVL